MNFVTCMGGVKSIHSLPCIILTFTFERVYQTSQVHPHRIEYSTQFVLPSCLPAGGQAYCSAESVQPSYAAKRRFWQKKSSTVDRHRIKIGLIFFITFFIKKKSR